MMKRKAITMFGCLVIVLSIVGCNIDQMAQEGDGLTGSLQLNVSLVQSKSVGVVSKAIADITTLVVVLAHETHPDITRQVDFVQGGAAVAIHTTM